MVAFSINIAHPACLQPCLCEAFLHTNGRVHSILLYAARLGQYEKPKDAMAASVVFYKRGAPTVFLSRRESSTGLVTLGDVRALS